MQLAEPKKRANTGLFILAFLGACTAATALAQPLGRPARLLPPEDITLYTKDGVKLGATYYPSTIGREAVPIVMLPDYKETRQVFDSLARSLQASREAHAVLTVDFRGHGESVTAVDRYGDSVELDAADMRPRDFRDIVGLDMEAVRKFLLEQNDLGTLNLNKLCLLGSGLGANVAVSWAAVDWSMPPLAQRKQGQDVKALILASPRWNQHGLPLLDAIRQPGVQQQLSLLITYGEEDPRTAKDVRTIVKNVEKFHPDPPRDRVREEKDLFVIPLATRLQGTRLLTDREFNMLPTIEAFLAARLSEQNYPWIQRRFDR